MNRIVNFYFKNKKKIHVTCNSGRFYNGSIKEINLDEIILLDDKLGEIIILFNEIEQLEPFKEENKNANPK